MTLHNFVKAVSSRLFPTNNRKWVTLQILWRQFDHHIYSYHQQFVSEVANLWKSFSSHCFPSPTGSEWHCTFCEREAHHIFALIACEWHCALCARQPHQFFSYHQQLVSDIADFVKNSLFLLPTACEWHYTYFISVKGCLITSFSITNSEWVTLHILWTAVATNHFLSPTASVWHCTFCERQFNHICSCDQQSVSDIEHFVDKVVSLHLLLWLTGSEHILWKTVSSHCLFEQGVSEISHILQKAVGSSHHLFLWLTACEWDCTFCERQSHHIFLLSTGSEWHCTFCEQQSYHIISHNQQRVSDIVLFVGRSFPMTNSKWVAFHICVPFNLFQWPTACGWHCIFCEKEVPSHLFHDQQLVGDIAHFMKDRKTVWFNGSFPMTNSLWVRLYYIFWRECFLWETGSE